MNKKGFVTVVTPPASDPVTLDEAKEHLRVDIADDDTLITVLISAATEYVATVTRRSIMTQTLKLVLPEFPADSDLIRLPYPPFYTISIGQVQYRDATDGTLQTWDSANYEVVQTGALCHCLRYVLNGAWPTSVLDAVDAVQITYAAGEASAADVDERIKLAIKLLVGHWYENREDTTPLNLRTIPTGVEMLLWQVRATAEFFS